jgi:hypothetical protein
MTPSVPSRFNIAASTKVYSGNIVISLFSGL